MEALPLRFKNDSRARSQELNLVIEPFLVLTFGRDPPRAVAELELQQFKNSRQRGPMSYQHVFGTKLIFNFAWETMQRTDVVVGKFARTNVVTRFFCYIY
jgi:hypothetical protein